MIENLEKVVENGSTEDMRKLAELFEDMLYSIKDYDEEQYEDYSMCLYKIANGKLLTPELAQKIVKHMKPVGEHWTIEQTTQVKNQYGFNDIRDVDFYVVMNSAYNDYKDIFRENLDVYAQWSKAFIKDDDAVEGKVFTYFTTIPKE